MKYFTGVVFSGLIACVLFVLAANAQVAGQGENQEPARNRAAEQKIEDELKKVAPGAVEDFKKATAALDSNDLPGAVILYRKVLTAAPKFAPAMRRIGYAYSYLGQREEGLKMTAQALEGERSADNLFGHAVNLACVGVPECEPIPTEITQALSLAKEASQKGFTESREYFTLAQIQLMANDIEGFNKTAPEIGAKFPDEGGTHYFLAIYHANRSELDLAEKSINKAESMGLDAESATSFRAAIKEEKGNAYFGLGKYLTFFYIGLGIVALWAVGLVVLFISGKVLSSKTLHSIETGDPNDIAGEQHSGLRKLYRNIISIAGIYWYISQPVVMLLVVVVTGGIILMFFIGGTIPVKLTLIIGFIGAATLFYMIKSLFVRVNPEDPGRSLTEEEAPGLWQTVREVAETVNTRPVNEIRITPGTDLAVYERGGMRDKMQDKAERILILGTAVLNGFDQNAFRAVLAHEYGHFSNRDTAGGDIAYRVNEHIFRLAEAMGEGGTATFYNIAFQFLRLYHFIFRRITHGATRLQEVLADRVAVYQYGAAAFREGLTHVVRSEVEFSHLADKELNASYNASRAMQNLYDLTLDSDGEDVKSRLEEQVNEIINRATTEDDTHPAPADRFKLAERITSRESTSVTGQVWDLFKDRESLVEEMNAIVAKSFGMRTA